MKYRLRLPWAKKPAEPDDQGLTLARELLAAAEAVQPYVDEVVRDHESRVKTNHLAPLIESALQAKRWSRRSG